MLTLAQWSVGRRIWKNESLEWQFCYKLVFIDLGLIQNHVKLGKTQPLPWARLGPKGLESWQASQVPCLSHWCLPYVSWVGSHLSPGTLTFLQHQRGEDGVSQVFKSVCQMDRCIFYLHWNVPSRFYFWFDPSINVTSNYKTSRWAEMPDTILPLKSNTTIR